MSTDSRLRLNEFDDFSDLAGISLRTAAASFVGSPRMTCASDHEQSGASASTLDSADVHNVYPGQVRKLLLVQALSRPQFSHAGVPNCPRRSKHQDAGGAALRTP